MYSVAFVYEGYGCYGMLMWVSQDDAEARLYMLISGVSSATQASVSPRLSSLTA